MLGREESRVGEAQLPWSFSLLRDLALVLSACSNPLGLVWAPQFFLVPEQHNPTRAFLHPTAWQAALLLTGLGSTHSNLTGRNTHRISLRTKPLILTEPWLVQALLAGLLGRAHFVGAALFLASCRVLYGN